MISDLSKSLPLLLPAVEDGIFSDSWRIRQSPVELLGDLLFMVAGTSGKALLEGGSDDEGASTEAQGRAIIEVLGREKRNEVLAALYMVRTDVSLTVRQGVCIGLSEVMASAGKSQLLSFMDELIPTICTALCDRLSIQHTLQAIDEIVPTLLHALEDDETSDTALDGLKQILNVRTTAVLLHILPKLVHPPLSAFNAHALGALAEVEGLGLDFYLSTVVPSLLTAMDDDNMEVQNLAKKATETVVLVIDEEGIEPLISKLLKGVGDHQASIKRSSSYLLGYFFKNSKLYLVDEAPNVITTLIVAWEALSRVVGLVPKEVLPSYIKLVRDAISTSRHKERRKRKVRRASSYTWIMSPLSSSTIASYLSPVKLVSDEKVKRSKGYAFIQYTSQDDALLALETMDHKIIGGWLKNRNITAIKVLSPESSQGVKEFLTEIRVISDIEHQNLVKLYGCCVDEDHRILVYNYLENNSLAQTLIGLGSNNTGI
ncbi:Protein ILITYHIA [Camellia lanceoleosa]|uniref:Protein ILITYHIA n=1 Tax=Camellia lanceoleosa TaxID=1840588 RepID=A0ACC0IYM1_9ERIC|nr:Protein ILITYHIA [Camellia lanceoleosa]